jgi:hypothetical protein
MAKIAKTQVLFDTMPYEKSHGKQPRGQGGWAFIDAQYERRDDYLDFVKFFYGSYAVAKRQAREHFAALGVEIVAVLS